MKVKAKNRSIYTAKTMWVTQSLRIKLPAFQLVATFCFLLAACTFARGGIAAAATSLASCTPSGTTFGTDTLSVAIPSSASYHIWVRVQVPSVSASSPLLLNMDNAAGTNCYAVSGSSVGTANTWTWVEATAGLSALPALNQGNHTLVVTGTQGGASLDRIEFLNDGSCVPTGTGDNCTTVATDTTKPTVAVTAPTNGATVSGTTNLTATASDDSGTVSKVEFYDGTTLLATDTASPYSFSWNTTTVANGSHTITAKAYDPSGNVGTSSAVAVTVNNAPSCGTGTLAAPTALAQNQTPTYTTTSLKWTAPNPTPGCTISSYNIFRGGTKVGTSVTTSFADSGLTAGTTYTYTVQAVDSGPNTSAQSAGLSLTTTADNLAPTVPSSFAATATGPGQVNLSWTASTDNPNPGGVGVKGYNIYRNGATSPTFTVSGASASSFADTTATASTHYTYIITAIDNANNESAPSASISATTPAPTCSGSPSLPTSPVAGTRTISSVNFSWTASAASAGCTLSGYHIYQVTGGSTYTLIPAAPTGTSITVTGLTPNTSYTYAIEAFDTSGHASARTTTITITTMADTTAPTAPALVTATVVSAGQVSLTWTASTDNVGVTGYKIYRSDKGTTALATLSGSTLSYNDTTVAANTDYTYQVTALDAANNESTKATASPNPVHTPTAVDTTAPTAPKNLAAPVVASQSANLTWTASTDNTAVAGYHVYLNNVYDSDTTTSSFTASCVAPGVTYSVTVKAFDGTGNVSAADSGSFTTPAGVSGDVNCDGVVNSTDLFTLLRNWQQTAVLPTSGDANGDATVNSTDLFDLLRNWGKSS